MPKDSDKIPFRERHPQRQRVPKGFADRFQLSIKEVQDGSAIPVLLRNSVIAMALFGEHEPDELDEARYRATRRSSQESGEKKAQMLAAYAHQRGCVYAPNGGGVDRMRLRSGP